jgi:hypothetical protein
MAVLSREIENWDYASSRLHWMPFSWLNPGPSTSAFDDAKSALYVERQLLAMRKWGMGGMFPNFVYGALRLSDYTPYASALRAASSPARVDGADPTLELVSASPELPTIEGTARDNLGIRAVHWHDDLGGSGTTELTWKILSGGPASGYQWAMRWSLPAADVSPGATFVSVVAEDIKGHISAPASFSWDGPDTTAPNTTITAGPSGITKTTYADLSFQSSEPESTFACRLDGGAWSPCTSPKRYSGLADGHHTFEVRATDSTGQADPSPASMTWTIRSRTTKPPSKPVTSGVTPSNPVPGTTSQPPSAATPAIIRMPPRRLQSERRRATATFELSGAEQGAELVCRLDRRHWLPCGTGSITYKIRARPRWTRHRFVIREAHGAPGSRADRLRYTFRVRRR